MIDARATFFGIVCCLAVCPVQSTQLAVSVVDADGLAVEGAVVVLEPAQPQAQPDTGKHRRWEIRQQNTSFVPNVLAIRVGDEIEFPNDDPVLHHVYSFSPPKSFELTLYGQAEKPSVTFDAPGVVVLGCNIHDNMRGYVYVSESPYVAVSAAAGPVEFANVPAGGYAMTVWHADLKDGESLSRPLELRADTAQVEKVTLSLRRPRGRELDKFERGHYH